jgi:uncharacterized protein (TIGR02246 family)
MRIFKRNIVILAVAAILTAIVIAPSFAADDAKSIAERVIAKWGEIYNKGDAAAMTALYTGDAVLMPQGSDQPSIGQASIRKFFDEWLKQRLVNVSIPVVEAKMIDQKTIWAAGTWAGDIPGQNGGSSTHVNGTWLNVMSQDGSEWKLSADTWNMMPPPAATAVSNK